MANDIAARQWLLDTASATPLYTSTIFVEQFEFVGFVNDTDTCVLKDQTGRIVWQGNGSADLSPVRSGKIGAVNGLILSTLDNAGAGARVIVYTR